MIAFPAGTKVWIAGGVTDMRRGMNTLAVAVQQGLGRDPHAGEIFCFRGRKGDFVKLLWHDGVGMSLYIKRLEAGTFIWPVSQDGTAIPIAAAQLGYLLEGIDWRNPRWTVAPCKSWIIEPILPVFAGFLRGVWQSFTMSDTASEIARLCTALVAQTARAQAAETELAQARAGLMLRRDDPRIEAGNRQATPRQIWHLFRTPGAAD
jgi:transposase